MTIKNDKKHVYLQVHFRIIVKLLLACSDLQAFFYKKRFFSTQTQYCLTFS